MEMADHSLGVSTHVILMAIVLSVILLFVGIAVLVLIHVCIVGRVLRGLSVGDMNIVMRGGFGSTSMSKDDIEKLPCFDFKPKEIGASPAGDCAVCLERFSAGEKCRLLPSCNHSFHAECVDLWLLRSTFCPVCRAGADLGTSEQEERSCLGETVETREESENVVHGNENEIEIQIEGECENRNSEAKVEIGDSSRINQGIENEMLKDQTVDGKIGLVY